MKPLSHGLQEIPLINTPFNTQDNHVKVHVAVPQGSAFVPCRPSQSLMDYQNHEVSKLTM